MGQPCQEDPNDLDPTLGKAFLSPAQIEEQLAMLRTGRYRFSAVSKRYGQSPKTMYSRWANHPELRARYEAALAEGEMRQCDHLAEADDSVGTSKATFFLERMHRVSKPVDRAREREIIAAMRAGYASAAGDLESKRRLREFLVEASTVSEGDPTANAENAGEGA